MSILGAIALDFAELLKKQSKGWTITPLVVSEPDLPRRGDLDHNDFLFVKKISHNQSPIDFYKDNPPLAHLTFLSVKKQNCPLRVIGLRLEATVNYSMHLTFWRANGYAQSESSVRSRYQRSHKYGGGLDGHNALLMCQVNHVGPKPHKGRRHIHEHSFDLTVPTPPTSLVSVVVQIIEKSYRWWGRGRKECFGHYQFPLMVDLDGKNYNADRYHV